MSKKTRAARRSRKQQRCKERQQRERRANTYFEVVTGNVDVGLESDVPTELDEDDMPPLEDISDDEYPCFRSCPLLADVATRWSRYYTIPSAHHFRSVQKYLLRDSKHAGRYHCALCLELQRAGQLGNLTVASYDNIDATADDIREHLISHYIDVWVR
ncbi:hypothetical protein PM082_023570 [Marasmius tenuissimus]|nr:hypothetical protein PM082_023570 [Marasmius tenuissimus]